MSSSSSNNNNNNNTTAGHQYPTRGNRGRAAAEVHNMAAEAPPPTPPDVAAAVSTTPFHNPSSTTPTSGYRMGTTLVNAKISPMKQSQSKKFFPSSSSRLSTGSNMHNNHESEGKTSSASKQQQPSTTDDIIVDGMNLSELRGWVESSMGKDCHTAPSPSMAVLYASLLYSKTNSPQDAFLCGLCLYQNNEYKRCVEWMERKLIIGGNNSNNLQLESLLLTATALQQLQDWNGMLGLLEDTLLYSGLNELQDDDDIAWMQVKEGIMPDRSTLHPLARVCHLRAIAYAELGHPLRAAIYWKRALLVDGRCSDALDALMQVVHPLGVFEIVQQLEAPEWLRYLYQASVHVAAPTAVSDDSSPAAQALATSMSMEHSIQNPQEDGGENSYSNNNRQSMDRSFAASAANEEQPTFNDPFTPIAQQPNSFFGSAGRNDSSQVDDSYTAIYQAPRTQASSKAAGQALNKLTTVYHLHDSPQVLAMAAQQAFQKYDFSDCVKYCQALLPFLQGKAAFCYVSTLVQLGQKRTLFRLAHEWVEAAPKEARSWFAVGSYYYACGRYHVAQRHFCRATRLDSQCAEAWVAFGASFAACDESDQALASFRAAQRIAPGHHVSLLYIGMEYLRTNHLVLAQHFLMAAHDSCHGTDALAMSELGVLNMNQKKYDHAIAWFLQALGANAEVLRETERHHPKALLDVEALENLVDGVQDDYWEPTLFNLAHAYRKEMFLEHAIVCLERCLALKESAAAYSALGYCLHLQAMAKPLSAKEETNLLLKQAIDTYHQALARKPNAAFCLEMLTKALANALEMTDFFVDATSAKSVAGGSASTDGLSNLSTSGIMKQDQSSFFSPPKTGGGTASASGGRSSSMGIDQSSMEDGLSLSLGSDCDVDMS